MDDSEAESEKDTVTTQPKAASLPLASRITRPDEQPTVEDQDDEMEDADAEESNEELVQTQQTSRRNVTRKSNTPRHNGIRRNETPRRNGNRENDNPRRNNNRRTPASRGGMNTVRCRGSFVGQTAQNNDVNRRQNFRQASPTHRIVEARRALVAKARKQQNCQPPRGLTQVYQPTHRQSGGGQAQRRQNR